VFQKKNKQPEALLSLEEGLFLCLFKIWERVLYSPLGLQKDILLVQLAPLRCYVWRYLGLTPHQQPISPFIEQSPFPFVIVL
jgi:hypothetical protein